MVAQSNCRYEGVHLLDGPSNTFAMGDEPPILNGCGGIERKDTVTKKIVLEALYGFTQMFFSRAFGKAFNPEPQFRQDRRANKYVGGGLSVEPLYDVTVRIGVEAFRNNISVKNDHSKSGGRLKEPELSKTRSSPRYSLATRSRNAVPKPLSC